MSHLFIVDADDSIVHIVRSAVFSFVFANTLPSHDLPNRPGIPSDDVQESQQKVTLLLIAEV